MSRAPILSVLLLLVIALAAALATAQDRASTRSAGRVVASTGGVAEIVLPPTWRELADLHEEADLQAGNPRVEAYFIVLSEPKADFDPDLGLEGHSDLTRQTMLEALKDPQVSEPTRMEINGMKAVQYRVEGSTEGLRIVYFHTTVEGREHFHQIVAWTLPSRLEANRPHIDAALQSFRERPAATTRPGS